MTYQMNQAETQLVEALESGNYKQGIGCLENGADCFCCLGVAEHLAMIHSDIPITKSFIENEAAVRYVEDDKHCSTTNLTPRVANEWINWTPFGDIHPECEQDVIQYLASVGYTESVFGVDNDYDLSLATANDNGVAFPHIAHIIRQGWMKRAEGQENYV